MPSPSASALSTARAAPSLLTPPLLVPSCIGRDLQAKLLPDGRLHLQQGPIDLIIEAYGAPDEVRAAYHQAHRRFFGLLESLVSELAELRKPASHAPRVCGPVARAMVAAVMPHQQVFITPMAAVAGAVADAVLAATVSGRELEKAYVNDGGDIAFALSPGESLTFGVVPSLARGVPEGRIVVDAASPTRGIATSGWEGRSLSRGIADAVTVLAETAAVADAAATMIANAVFIAHPSVEQRPAESVVDDSDLGRIPVTVAVGPLPPEAVAEALASGVAEAERLRTEGLIGGALIALQSELRVVGKLAPPARSAGARRLRARVLP